MSPLGSLSFALLTSDLAIKQIRHHGLGTMILLGTNKNVFMGEKNLKVEEKNEHNPS